MSTPNNKIKFITLEYNQNLNILNIKYVIKQIIVAQVKIN